MGSSEQKRRQLSSTKHKSKHHHHHHHKKKKKKKSKSHRHKKQLIKLDLEDKVLQNALDCLETDGIKGGCEFTPQLIKDLMSDSLSKSMLERAAGDSSHDSDPHTLSPVPNTNKREEKGESEDGRGKLGSSPGGGEPRRMLTDERNASEHEVESEGEGKSEEVGGAGSGKVGGAGCAGGSVGDAIVDASGSVEVDVMGESGKKRLSSLVAGGSSNEVDVERIGVGAVCDTEDMRSVGGSAGVCGREADTVESIGVAGESCSKRGNLDSKAELPRRKSRSRSHDSMRRKRGLSLDAEEGRRLSEHKSSRCPSGASGNVSPSMTKKISGSRSLSPVRSKTRNRSRSRSLSSVRSRRRSKSRSLSSVRSRRRSRSRSLSLIRSKTRKKSRSRSLSPVRSRRRSKSRSLSPVRSRRRSRSRSRSLVRSKTRKKSRSRSLSPVRSKIRKRSKSRCLSPVRSKTRKRSRSRSLSPVRSKRRSKSRRLCPVQTRNRRKSKSRRLSPVRSRNRRRSKSTSLSPVRSKKRSRSRSLSPVRSRGKIRSRSRSRYVRHRCHSRSRLRHSRGEKRHHRRQSSGTTSTSTSHSRSRSRSLHPRYDSRHDRHRNRSRRRHYRSNSSSSRHARSSSLSRFPQTQEHVEQSISTIALEFSDLMQANTKKGSLLKLTNLCKDLQKEQEVKGSGDSLVSKREEEGVGGTYRAPFAIRTVETVHRRPGLVFHNNVWKTSTQVVAEMNSVADIRPLTDKFPVSAGLQHKASVEAGGGGGGGKERVANTGSVFGDVKALDINDLASKRTIATLRLKSNPTDPEAHSLLTYIDQQAKMWADTRLPLGQFTGQQKISALTAQDHKAGFQAWAKKKMFHGLAPVMSGFGAKMMRKMGWNEGEALGKMGVGHVEPLVLDVKLDRHGLTTPMDKKATAKKGAGGPFGMLPNIHVRTKATNSKAAHLVEGKHPVSALQEICAKKHWGPPNYELIRSEGPSNKKAFQFSVTIPAGTFRAVNESKSKKHGKMEAAKAALEGLGLIAKT